MHGRRGVVELEGSQLQLLLFKVIMESRGEGVDRDNVPSVLDISNVEMETNSYFTNENSLLRRDIYSSMKMCCWAPY